MAAINDRYCYTVTLNGVQAALLEALTGQGLHGRNASDVIRRILDRQFQTMVEGPKLDLRGLPR